MICLYFISYLLSSNPLYLLYDEFSDVNEDDDRIMKGQIVLEIQLLSN